MGILEYFGPEYQYYDTPDGEDCLKKLWFVTKYSGLYGILYSSVDVIAYSHPQGYPQILARFAYITLPVMGMGGAFSAASCISTNMRKKDDQWNYFWGGVSAGLVAGAWKKSLKVGSYASLGLGALAAIIKDLNMRGVQWTGSPSPRKSGDFRMIQRDFSFTADPGKN